MKEPKKIGRGLAGGVILISIIYLFITIGFQVSGNGAITGTSAFMPEWLFKAFNGFVAVGIMGIVNSYAMSSPRQFADMSHHGEAKEFT